MRYLIKITFLIAMVAGLTACGGSGSTGSDTLVSALAETGRSCNQVTRYARSDRVRRNQSTIEFTGYHTKGRACSQSGGAGFYIVPIDDITNEEVHICINRNHVVEINYSTRC